MTYEARKHNSRPRTMRQWQLTRYYNSTDRLLSSQLTKQRLSCCLVRQGVHAQLAKERARPMHIAATLHALACLPSNDHDSFRHGSPATSRVSPADITQIIQAQHTGTTSHKRDNRPCLSPDSVDNKEEGRMREDGHKDTSSSEVALGRSMLLMGSVVGCDAMRHSHLGFHRRARLRNHALPSKVGLLSW